MHRDFFLPEEDSEHLDSLGLTWELVREGNKQWVIIRHWPIPDGYTASSVDLALMINPAYPDAQIDMAYFFPHLLLKNGREIKATNATQKLEGKHWQRWSRHRSRENPWRPGLDDISSHLTLVQYWIARELVKEKAA
jgi:hypothetical protein